MKLALKFAIALFLGIFTVLAVNASMRIQRERALFETDIQRDHRVLGNWLARAVEAIWSAAGEAKALAFLERANAEQTRLSVRWVRIDASDKPPWHASGDHGSLDELAAGQTVVVKRDDGHGGTLYTYVPFSLPTGRRAAIEIRESLAEQEDYVGRTIREELVTTGTLVAFCGGIAIGLGVIFIGRPMRRIVEKARRIGAGDFSGRVVLAQRDEMGELATEMNTMSELLEEATQTAAREAAARIAAVEQLRHADRLTTVGKLASGIAHELGTPLNVITGRADLIIKAYPPGTTGHDNACYLRDQANLMTRIIRQLLDFARRRRPQKSREDLSSIVRHTLVMLEPLARKYDVSLVMEEDGSVSAEADWGQLQQALTNVVMNGIQTMSTGGRLAVCLRCEQAKPPPYHSGTEGEYVRIDVRDEGPGMPPEILEHVFEPFFTTKTVGEGTGLGLSVTYAIVQEHGGWISVESKVDEGTCLSIFLPNGAPA